MKIELWPVERPIPYARNARKIGEAAITKVATSLKEFGWRQPVVVDGEGVIIAGHTRLLAAQRLGLAEVPVHVAEGLSPAQVKAYRLMDNRSHEEAEWDYELLGAELFDLKGLDLDLGLTGFDGDELAELMARSTENKDADDVPEPPASPVSMAGDLWLLGSHRVMCSDSRERSEVMRLMDGQEADMVLTDPPYGMFLDTDFSTIKGSLKSVGRKNGTQGKRYDSVAGDHDDFSPELITTIFACFPSCAEMFIFGADYFAELLPARNDGSWLVWDKRKQSQAEAIGSEFELCWSRQKHKRRVLRHDWFGFLSSENQSDARNRIHPTQKPVTLLQDIMEQWGKPGEVVVDLYGGSGSTLIACEKSSRPCCMMELTQIYCDVIVQRWQNFTGKQATLDGSNQTFEEVKASRTSEGGIAAAPPVPVIVGAQA